MNVSSKIAIWMVSLSLVANPFAQVHASPSEKDQRSVEIARSILAGGSEKPELRLKGNRAAYQKAKLVLQQATQSQAGLFAKDLGHTFLFVISLITASTVVKNLKESGGNLQTLSPAELEKVASETSHALINDGQFWSGLLAATGSAAVMVPVVESMTKLFTQPHLRKAMESALKYGVVKTLTMVGAWSFGAQLWTEALLMIEDPKDLGRARELMRLGMSSLRSLLGSTSPSELEDRRIAQLIFTNMIAIVYSDPELRGTFFNNTWRTQLMTGEFVSYLSALIAAGFFGGTLLALGAGVFAKAVLPKERLQDVTFALQDIRRKSLDLNFLSTPFLVAEKTALPLARFSDFLEERRVSRSNYTTILLEQVSVAISLAQIVQKPETQSQGRILVEDALKRTQRFYLSEKSMFENILNSKHTISEANQKRLQAELDHLNHLILFFDVLSRDLSTHLESLLSTRGMADVSSSQQSLLNYVTLTYARGFSEERFDQAWKAESFQ